MAINRPQNEVELQKREAIGVIRASRFVRRYVNTHKTISTETICGIHYEIFRDAWPEIAGVYRKEELSITDSDLQLPHSSKVPELMKELDNNLEAKLKELKDCEGHILSIEDDPTEQTVECIEKLLNTVAWLHHKITFIHPFREGNGRTARLAGNLVLERYGLVGVSVKIEEENKNAYRKALSQIDKFSDYEPLKGIIADGIIERYDGVPIKYYKEKK